MEHRASGLRAQGEAQQEGQSGWEGGKGQLDIPCGPLAEHATLPRFSAGTQAASLEDDAPRAVARGAATPRSSTWSALSSGDPAHPPGGPSR